MQEALISQAAWTASQVQELSEQYISEDLTELTNAQQIALQSYLTNNLPSVGSYLSRDAVLAYFSQTFTTGVKALYSQYGAPHTAFTLKSPAYLAQLASDTDYLLNRSSLDQTTIKDLIRLIQQAKSEGLTRKQLAKLITDTYPDIAATRADMIAQTETANVIGKAQYSAAKESGVLTKEWVCYGVDPCQVCLSNAGQGFISMDAMFDSGDLYVPGHPRCECANDYGKIDVSALWGGE